MNTNQDLLGEVITFHQGAREVPAQIVKDSLASAGIELDMPEMRMTTAFNRATKELKRDHVIRPKKDKTADRSFQLNRIDETGEVVNYDYEATVAINPETGAVRCGEDSELAEKIQDGVQAELKVRNTSDITRLVQKMFERNADLFPINPLKATGTYFVPVQHRDFTAKVETFLKMVGGQMWRFPVPNGTTEGNKSVQEAVKTGLDEMVRELQEAVAAWEPGKTRSSTADKAMKRLEALRYKASAYEVFLEAEKDKLGASLEAARIQMEARIAELAEAAEAEANADPEPPDAQADTQAIEKAARRAAYSEGWDAADSGQRPESNPYVSTPRAKDWDDGYQAAAEMNRDESAAA